MNTLKADLAGGSLVGDELRGNCVEGEVGGGELRGNCGAKEVAGEADTVCSVRRVQRGDVSYCRERASTWLIDVPVQCSMVIQSR